MNTLSTSLVEEFLSYAREQDALNSWDEEDYDQEIGAFLEDNGIDSACDEAYAQIYTALGVNFDD